MAANRAFFIAIVSIIALLGGSAAADPGRTQTASEVQYQTDLEASVALLYAETDEGALVNLCTCTPFERSSRDPKLYRFVTAAHCVSDDDTREQLAKPVPTSWYVTFDKSGMKQFYPAKLVASGYMSAGDDVAVLEAKIDDATPMVTPISTEKPYRLQEVINVAGPLGLGKQFFQGYVTRPSIDRPLIFPREQINWQGAILLDISANPGSSGSAVVDRKTHKIISILVGVMSMGGTPHVVAIPAARFNSFYGAIKAGKYRYFKPETVGAQSSTRMPVNTSLKRIRQRIIERFSGQLKPDAVKDSWSGESGTPEPETPIQ